MKTHVLVMEITFSKRDGIYKVVGVLSSCGDAHVQVLGSEEEEQTFNSLSFLFMPCTN